MAGKVNKKQRHEAKRKAKRLAVRRQDSISPVKRLSDAKGEIDCWSSGDFEIMGQIQIFAYKQAAGLFGVACFLVDEGVVGLKDSWVRLGVDRKEFQRMLDAGAGSGIRMRRVAIEEALRWIAGGARWAHDNGMRLPKDWLRHASMLGAIGDWKNADVSEFAMEFAGHPEDLRRRLIGESVGSFLARDDIRFVLNSAAPYKDQRTGEYASDLNDDALDDEEAEDDLELPDETTGALNALGARIEMVAVPLAPATQEWLAVRNEVGSPELAEAWQSVITSSLLAVAAMPNASHDEIWKSTIELLEESIRQTDPSAVTERKRAVEQVLRHLKADSAPFVAAVKALSPTGEPSLQ